MADRIEFITEAEETREMLFEKYFNKNIVPAIEEENRVKEKYRSRFWGYLWSACFLLGANTLIVFFRYLMYHYTINYEQLFLVVLLAMGVIILPIYQYHHLQKTDLFSLFLRFFGNFKHLKEDDLKSTYLPIVPPHETEKVQHSITGNVENNNVQICEMVYQSTMQLKKWKFKRTVSSGVIVDVKFDKKFNNVIYLFDKKGFYRKNKYPDLLNITENIPIPAANYFHIFTKNEDFAKDMMPSVFFEYILDLKEVFKARNLYVQFEENSMRLYLEGAYWYFENNSLRYKSDNKAKFVILYRKISQILEIIQLIKIMKA